MFKQIRGFGEYGFPESHAASFALLVYVSAWLKHYYPAAFAAALINSQPMGFYAPAQLVRDAREHGVEVLPVDVNASGWDCTLEEARLRLGFRLLGGISKAHGREGRSCPPGGPFTSLDEFTRRTRLSQAVVAQLAEADAFGSLRLDRRTALWQALEQEHQPRALPLLAGLDDDEPTAELPPMPLIEQVFADYRASGLSLKAHPLSFFRRQLDQLRRHSRRRPGPLSERPAAERGRHRAGAPAPRHGQRHHVRHAGRRNRRGEPGHPTEIWERFYAVARCSPAWIAHGLLQSKDTVIHLVVNRLEGLSDQLGNLNIQSRDFH